MNEMLRKLIVSLKRKPQTIAMLSLVIAFLVYSLNLTAISNTTAKIQGSGMGLCGFTTMLLSILSFVCFLNAFPYRKKVNMPMLVLMFAMFAIVVYCDWYYLGAIIRAITRAESPISPVDFPYVAKAQSTLHAQGRPTGHAGQRICRQGPEDLQRHWEKISVFHRRHPESGWNLPGGGPGPGEQPPPGRHL